MLDGLACYQVGGSVRDRLLGLDSPDRDFVLVGTQPEELVKRGFRPVGRDFPVFLHPISGEEYALARTERKSGHGYHGFHFHAGPEVTLEEDLLRRDLTINAMALAPDGQLIDPYGGRLDLTARRLRHVSPAFVEDPLRVLRLARFATRFPEFTIAEKTLDLARRLAASGELGHLVAERVWSETSRAMLHAAPSRYFDVLREVGALKVILPEIDALFGIPQDARYHPEIDTGRHTLMVLDQAAELGGSLAVRYACLVHDLGKALTPPEKWPAHHGHEQSGVALIDAVSERLAVPGACRDLARLVGRWHLHAHRALELRPFKVLELLERLDGFRRPDRVEEFLLACRADRLGRAGQSLVDYPEAEYLRRAHAAAAEVTASPFVEQGLTGEAIGQAITRERQRRIKALRARLTNKAS